MTTCCCSEKYEALQKILQLALKKSTVLKDCRANKHCKNKVPTDFKCLSVHLTMYHIKSYRFIVSICKVAMLQLPSAIGYLYKIPSLVLWRLINAE